MREIFRWQGVLSAEMQRILSETQQRQRKYLSNLPPLRNFEKGSKKDKTLKRLGLLALKQSDIECLAANLRGF